MNQITKRIIIYILGTFLLGIGVTFSIKADLGVSPVSSLGYAIALITSISVGTAVFLSNLVFIAVQFLLSGKFEAKNYLLQLISSVLVSVFIDFTGKIVGVIIKYFKAPLYNWLGFSL